MIVSAIVAVAKNNVIGIKNQIPWYLPADLKFFKKTTLDHHVIMGRKTFESIGKPLPNRTNVVITRDPFYAATGCMVVHSLDEALALAEKNGENEAFIIGGGQMYEQSWPRLDKIYLTEVDATMLGDVYFPKIDAKEWEEVFWETHPSDEKNQYGYTFRVLERKKLG
jgi:dihydrofolate reductase